MENLGLPSSFGSSKQRAHENVHFGSSKRRRAEDDEETQQLLHKGIAQHEGVYSSTDLAQIEQNLLSLSSTPADSLRPRTKDKTRLRTSPGHALSPLHLTAIIPRLHR